MLDLFSSASIENISVPIRKPHVFTGGVAHILTPPCVLTNYDIVQVPLTHHLLPVTTAAQLLVHVGVKGHMLGT